VGEFVAVDGIEWCIVHQGVLNEDSDVCDAHDWDKDDEDIECSPVELFMRFDRVTRQ
jgi:hypothetical protein